MNNDTKIMVKDLHLYYGENHALKGINMNIRPNAVTAFIGPSGCGKSTFLKIIQGEIEPQKGFVNIPKNERLAVLEQDHFKYDSYTVMDTVIMGNLRLYEIMKEKDTELKAKDTALTEYKELMDKRVDRLEYVLKHVAKLLATNTNYATMISGPSSRRNKIKFIQLSRIEQKKILVATVFEGNIINNRIITISEDISEKEIGELNMLLNTSLTGLTMDEINLATIMKLRSDAGDYSDVIDQVLTEVSEAFTNNEEEELEVYTSGATNIFKYPELTGGDAAGMLIEQFEKKDELRQMLSEINESYAADEEKAGIKVYIGEELPMHDMRDCSLVTANYDFGNGISGTIGIVGPKRMDYDKVLGTLKSVMKQLEETFRL